MPFRLTHHLGAKDTIHEESCSANQADKAETVDDETAAALVSIGGVRICDQCDPFGDRA